MITLAKEYVTDFYRLFYPSVCGGCEIPLAKGEHHLCMQCRLELPFTGFERLKGNPVEKVFYGRVPLEFATSLLYFSKGEKVQQILHNIKYNGRKELGLYMGRLIGAQILNNTYLQDVSTIIPVPLHPQKQYLRGYNQSALLAEGISEILKQKLSTDYLKRDVFTETQTSKNRVERWENVEKAFTLRHSDYLQNKHILLVDDVLTTGSTLEACTQLLLSAPNCKVSIVTLAFAVD